MEKEIPFKEEYEKLKILVSQGQFELIFSEEEKAGDIRLVYLMNDAVESFLVFRKARMTGSYEPDFQGELQAELNKDGSQYVLVVRQGKSVCTIFFQELALETHLFNYGNTGHFWVEGYEYLRQLEYRLAILRDKREYLGEDFCTEEERQISYLAEFPPLNFCCYPAVSEKYLVPSCGWWQVSEEALEFMDQLSEEAGDKSLRVWLRLYSRFPSKWIAKHIAWMLHRVSHGKVTDLIDRKLAQAASVYPDRDLGKGESAKGDSRQQEAERIQNLQKRAMARKKELELKGFQVRMLKEEPFLYVKDSVEYQIHLMVWKRKGRNRIVEVETIGKE